MSQIAETDPHAAELRRFVQALAMRRCGLDPATPGRAEKIVQQSLKSALAQAPHGSGRQLRGAVFSAAIQHHRALLRQEKFETGGEPMRGAEFSTAVDAQARQGAEQCATAKALAQLPDDSREVLLLVVLAQFSYVEAAQALGLSLAETFARLTRARTAFAALLARQERDEIRAFQHQAILGVHGPAGNGRRPAGQHLRLVK